ncbi:MAG TPA: PIN domain-containing protein [Rhizomicrobium sp.]
MKYLLDTNVLSDFVRGEHSVRERIKRQSPSALAISVVTELEVEYGLARAPQLRKHVAAAMRALINATTVVPFEREDARVAAPLRASLAASGISIGAYDLLLAASALRRDLVLVTHNVREFARVGGLGLEDWRT